MELLSNKRVKSFALIRREEAAQLVKKVRALAGKAALNLAEVFLEVTNNQLTRAAFGKECRSRGRFLRTMKETIRLMPVVSPMDLFPSIGSVISMLDGSMREMKRLHGELDAVLDEIISEHREKKVAGREDEGEDLVDVILNSGQRRAENSSANVSYQSCDFGSTGGCNRDHDEHVELGHDRARQKP
ncbi:hypothetical protein HPP92_005972 [Vanilla planifolia]|uniref:Uncharacterized protein n=1 Tax=Vanilla planifolia TaxID=51239 RepID=A0A835VF82_VANPL|nr:hypothetical protein HPP92_005972 [Vanilla planifolia]